MKTLTLSAALLTAVFPCLAFADTKDDVKAAAKKLAEAEGYSWTTTTDMGAASRFRGGPVEGKTLKNGISLITFKFGDNSSEMYLKNGNAVIKADGAWKTPEEMAAASEGGNRGRGFAGMMRNMKAPAAQAEELAGKAEKLEEKEGALAGALSAEAVKTLLTFGGRRPDGSAAPDPKDASGTVKFWIKDGGLAKMETHVKGTVSFNGEDRDIERTTTTEISAVGSTKLEVPEEAGKKLGDDKPAAEAK